MQDDASVAEAPVTGAESTQPVSEQAETDNADAPALAEGEAALLAAASDEVAPNDADVMSAGTDASITPKQDEMPFGLMDGKAITKLPNDLYIPPDALEVFLEAFQGPLDLLLYLIKRQNLDILDVPVAQITTQYMQYVELMKAMNLELAAEYLVMAAMLGEIKSRTLLPRAANEDEENEEDPRAELIRRLQEYERFKTAAEDIEALPREERDYWVANARRPEFRSERADPDVIMKDVLLALRDVMHRADMFESHHVSREKLSTRERMSDVLDMLRGREFVPFVALFKLEEGRAGVVVTFIAMLELVKSSLIELIQTEPFAPIHVKARMVLLEDEDMAPIEVTVADD
ncbi:MAG: segregation/condensation protein A [Gammaproteobacteria bacterium]|nr:segregation/condensation protein A [Gammaproteobacteria bacterium]